MFVEGSTATPIGVFPTEIVALHNMFGDWADAVPAASPTISRDKTRETTMSAPDPGFAVLLGDKQIKGQRGRSN
jgi:hypothetical protein